MKFLTNQNAPGSFVTDWHGGRGHMRLWGTGGVGVTFSLIWAEEGETPTKVGSSTVIHESATAENQSFFELPAGKVGVMIEGTDGGTSLSASVHKLPAT